jgi:hypothetical protein
MVIFPNRPIFHSRNVHLELVSLILIPKTQPTDQRHHANLRWIVTLISFPYFTSKSVCIDPHDKLFHSRFLRVELFKSLQHTLKSNLPFVRRYIIQWLDLPTLEQFLQDRDKRRNIFIDLLSEYRTGVTNLAQSDFVDLDSFFFFDWYPKTMLVTALCMRLRE